MPGVKRAMGEGGWDELMAALHDSSNAERAVAAAATLQQTVTTQDVPRLLELLKDDSFFVREAAAWPLSDLGVTDALPELLEALHRGDEQGHDNDGLSAALADLARANPRRAHAVLEGIVASDEQHLREPAEWLLEFCSEEGDV